MKHDDTLWKSLLEDVFDDFFLFFFKDYEEKFDLNKGFEFLDKELEQLFPTDEADANTPRFVDKLVKMFTKDGREEWVLVHVEVQGYNDPGFAKRMFTYFYRILDKYNKPVTSIAIFTDTNKNFKPNEYRYNFMGVENIFKYNTYKIIEQDEDVLRRDENPFAIVILTVLIALKKGKLPEEIITDLKIELAKAFLKKPVPKEKARAIMSFLRYYIRLEKTENLTKFDNAIIEITNKNATTMGIEEFLLQRAEKKGRKEGREEGKEEAKVIFVKSLLDTTDFSNEKIASIADVTVVFVEKIKASLS